MAWMWEKRLMVLARFEHPLLNDNYTFFAQPKTRPLQCCALRDCHKPMPKRQMMKMMEKPIEVNGGNSISQTKNNWTLYVLCPREAERLRLYLCHIRMFGLEWCGSEATLQLTIYEFSWTDLNIHVHMVWFHGWLNMQVLPV